MSQHDQNVANADGATVRADLNNALAALFSTSSGALAPSTTVAHQLWADTTGNLLKKRNAANSGWLPVRTLDESFVLARSSNTTLGASDVGKAVVATGTFTQLFSAAATLGDGWSVSYRNDGTGVVTLDPSSTEQINGATTLALHPGESCAIFCNGTALKTFGLPAYPAAQSVRTSSSFSKTSDTTLADVTGLSAAVVAGATYGFTASLMVNNNGGGGGGKAAIAGTATATSIAYAGRSASDTPNVVVGSTTSLGAAVAGHNDGTYRHIVIEGRVVVNAGGTLTVQFAQNAGSANASTVLPGSAFRVERL